MTVGLTIICLSSAIFCFMTQRRTHKYVMWHLKYHGKQQRKLKAMFDEHKKHDEDFLVRLKTLRIATNKPEEVH